MRFLFNPPQPGYIHLAELWIYKHPAGLLEAPAACRCSTSGHIIVSFLSDGATHRYAQLAKAHMERRALVGAVSLADHHHIDAAGQGGLIDAFIQFFDGHQHLTCQLAHSQLMSRSTQDK
ncbi:hypothetical protein EYF80_010949 [Liparis tanakae]|uniref:Uncharacterized protein n=1 Tax=Liparis tanakae TaxID=230148 RepID=A0A4Z2IL70_9TELE|nr:hypothetical protein EYF80_010949 [Liparis tanakae]